MDNGKVSPWDDGELGQWARGQSDTGTLDRLDMVQLDAGTVYGRLGKGTTRILILGHWDAGTLARQSNKGAWDTWTMG